MSQNAGESIKFFAILINMDSAQNSPNKGTDAVSQIQKLDDSISKALMPEDLTQSARSMTARLKVFQNNATFTAEYDTVSRYINWITKIPWGKYSEDNLDINHAKQVLDKNHYGLTQVKEHILEFVAIMILAREKEKQGLKSAASRAPILSLVGLAGVGKTSIAYSIAETLGRRIERIPFGGLGSAAQLRGKSRLHSDSEPGLIVKAIRRAGTLNPVLLLDEIDRVSQDAMADVMGVLVELLDPAQNKAFLDHFIDYPIDLSKVLFIATSNNTKNISTAVIDRLEIIQMPSYNDNEKIIIGKNFILPQVLEESGLTPDEFAISDDVWAESIVRPLGYDPGVRGLYRVLQTIVRKTVYYMLTGKIARGQKFIVNSSNIKTFVNEWG